MDKLFSARQNPARTHQYWGGPGWREGGGILGGIPKIGLVGGAKENPVKVGEALEFHFPYPGKWTKVPLILLNKVCVLMKYVFTTASLPRSSSHSIYCLKILNPLLKSQ